MYNNQNTYNTINVAAQRNADVAARVRQQAEALQQKMYEQNLAAVRGLSEPQLNIGNTLNNQQRNFDNFMQANAATGVLDFMPTKADIISMKPRSNFNLNKNLSMEQAENLLRQRLTDVNLNIYNDNLSQLGNPELGANHFLRKDKNPFIRTVRNTYKSPDIKFSNNGREYYVHKYRNNQTGHTFEDLFITQDGMAFNKLPSNENHIYNKIKGAQDLSLAPVSIAKTTTDASIDIDNIPLQPVVVNRNLPHISGLYNELTPMQSRMLDEAFIKSGYYNPYSQHIRPINNGERSIRYAKSYSRGDTMFAEKTAHQPAASDAGLGSRDTASAAKQPTGRQIVKNEVLQPHSTENKTPRQFNTVYDNHITSQHSIVNNKNLQPYIVGDLRNQFRSGAPNVEKLYDGLSTTQIKSLENAISEGFAHSKQKLGTLDSLAKTQDALRRQIAAQTNPLAVRDLQTVDRRLTETLMPSGYVQKRQSLDKAQSLAKSYELGLNFNPETMNFADLGLTTLRDKHAFLQGQISRILKNSSDNPELLKMVNKNIETMRQTARKQLFDKNMRFIRENQQKQEQLQRLFNDIAQNKQRSTAMFNQRKINAANRYLNDNYRQIDFAGWRNVVQPAVNAVVRQEIIQKIEK